MRATLYIIQLHYEAYNLHGHINHNYLVSTVIRENILSLLSDQLS